MSGTLLYTAFHLNLAFSSIEVEDRNEVVRLCYWPLLRLAEEGIPMGIEATSYTLQEIDRIDPSWTAALRRLIETGNVELIASGYVQMIAPLVPPEMTAWNLKFGQEDYERLLGFRPKLALINEQAYSPGILPLYKAAGFEAIMMDWAEPASHHAGWGRAKYGRPQTVLGAKGCTMPVVWSDAISFQKFQRYAHGELDADEYFEFLSLQLADGFAAMPIYTSDAEVFDYRPGRFNTEAQLAKGNIEHTRIKLLLTSLMASKEVRLGKPSEALALIDPSAEPLALESAAAPVPVKKQRKYNILRWAVTGRDDLALNTYCWRRFAALTRSETTSIDEWRELCEFWASDYRTHITERRWGGLKERLPAEKKGDAAPADKKSEGVQGIPPHIDVRKEGRFLSVTTQDGHLIVNLHRGLAIHCFGLGEAGPFVAGAPSENSLIGTLGHGFYDDIAFGADFYSGHLVCEPVGSHKITDLEKCDVEVVWLPSDQAILISTSFVTQLGNIKKELRYFVEKHRVEVHYSHDWPLPVQATLRLAHITLNPRAFDRSRLYFATANGGMDSERHDLAMTPGSSLNHARPVSRLVSASTGLGMTNGVLEIGDDRHAVLLEMKREDAAGIGMVHAEPVADSFFLRGYITLRETDETSAREALGLREKITVPTKRYAITLINKPNPL